LKLSFIFIVTLTFLFGNASLLLFILTTDQFPTTGLYTFWFAFIYIGLIFVLNFGAYLTRQVLQKFNSPIKRRLERPSEKTSSRKTALRNLALIQLHLQIILFIAIADRISFGISTLGYRNASNYNATSTITPFVNVLSMAFLCWYSWIPIIEQFTPKTERPKTVVEEDEDEDEMLTFTAIIMGKRPTVRTLATDLLTLQTERKELIPCTGEPESVNLRSPSLTSLSSNSPITPTPDASRDVSLSSPKSNELPGTLVWNLVSIEEEKSSEKTPEKKKEKNHKVNL